MKIFLYSGTHWDREWYQPFQGFRGRLVVMTEEMINGLEKTDNYGVFHFDGQTIVLEDVMEIAPDLEERLGKLIKAGKIVIGPWYCMPDEFIISGESLIRNLQIGKEICHKWGVEPSKEGYICDIFGHIAQMPQIFDGMDIHHSVLGRGTNQHTTATHFRWQSPDGTDVVVYRLPDKIGYCDYSSEAGSVREGAENDTVEEIIEKTRLYCDEMIKVSNLPIVTFFDAIDHNNWHGWTYKYIEALKRMYPDAEVYHTNIMEMCKAVDEYKEQLPFKKGELNETAKRHGGYVHLITNVLSSRYPIKKANDDIQTKLELIVAPMYAFDKNEIRDGFLKYAQKMLIQNHPHDSICGCSLDQVHRDMMYRFDQSRLVCDDIIDRYRIHDKCLGRRDVAVCVKEDSHEAKILRIYNPLPYKSHRMINVDVRFKKDYKKYAEPFGYEQLCSFKIFDADGNEIPYGIKNIQTFFWEYDTYTLTFEADLLPVGIVDYEIRESDLPSRYLGTLPQNTYCAENDMIKVSVDPSNGAVTIFDKATGETYPNLMTLIDDGEIGDGWYHCNPKVDRSSVANLVSIEKCENNINSLTFRINMNLHIPAFVDFHKVGMQRSDEYIDVPVTHYVTMTKTDNFVTVKTIVDNKALDHRLKLRLETGIKGDRYFTNQAFTFIDRQTDYDMNTADWREVGSPEKATSGIVGKYSENGGIAFVSKSGIHEVAAYSDGNIDVTLMRCYRKTVGTAGEPDGQLQGIQEFDYIICPIEEKENSQLRLQRLQDEFRAGLLSFVDDKGMSGNKYEGLLEIKNETFIYTTANKLDEGFEFRVFNCSDKEEAGKIVLPKGSVKAELTYIDGRHIADIPVVNGEIELTLGMWKIGTVKVI